MINYNKILNNIKYKLIKIYKQLCYHDKQDFDQEVLVAILEGEQTYNPDLGDQDTYLFFQGYFGALKYIRDNLSWKNLTVHTEIPIESSMDSPDTEIYIEQLKQYLLDSTSTGEEVKVVMMYFYQDKSLRDISKEIGRSHVTVLNILKKVISKYKIRYE